MQRPSLTISSIVPFEGVETHQIRETPVVPGTSDSIASTWLCGSIASTSRRSESRGVAEGGPAPSTLGLGVAPGNPPVWSAPSSSAMSRCRRMRRQPARRARVTAWRTHLRAGQLEIGWPQDGLIAQLERGWSPLREPPCGHSAHHAVLGHGVYSRSHASTACGHAYNGRLPGRRWLEQTDLDTR